MTFTEALKYLYIDKRKAKLPDWGGYWFVDNDGYLHCANPHYTESELVSSSRVSEFATNKNWIIF